MLISKKYTGIIAMYLTPWHLLQCVAIHTQQSFWYLMGPFTKKNSSTTTRTMFCELLQKQIFHSILLTSSEKITILLFLHLLTPLPLLLPPLELTQPAYVLWLKHAEQMLNDSSPLATHGSHVFIRSVLFLSIQFFSFFSFFLFLLLFKTNIQ